MKICISNGITLSLLISLSACVSNTLKPENESENGVTSAKLDTEKGRQIQPQEPFDEKPGDVQFDNPVADLVYQIFIAELATKKGNPEIASSFYLNAAKESKNPKVAARAVRIASFAEKTEDALEAAKIWTETDPENSEASRVLAVLYLRNEQFDEAQAVLGKLLDTTDEESVSRNILLTGAMLQREATKEGAAKIALFLTELYPKRAESHYIHASLAMQAEQPKVALKSIESAIKIRPDWVESVILYPRILQENDKSEDAVKFLADFLKKHPKEDAVRLTYARTLVDHRQLEDARSQFELLAVKMPNNHDVIFALAMLSMQFKEYDEAKGYLNQLDKMGKANPQVIFYLGQIEEQKKDFDAAIDWYKKLTPGEYFVEAHMRISVILAKTKTIEAAINHLHQIPVSSEQEKREIILFEGNLLRDFKHYEKAYAYYTKLIEKTPEDQELLYFRALVAERLNKIDVVIRDLSYVIEKDPENSAALNALGYTLADRTNKLNEALKLIQRARDLEPDDPAIIDSLGWVNYRIGNLDEAIALLQEAMEKIDDGEVAAHFGEVLWAKGEKEKAINIWKKAKEKFSDNEILLKTMERFGQ